MGILFEEHSLGAILRVTAEPPYDLRGSCRVVYLLCCTVLTQGECINKEGTDDEQSIDHRVAHAAI